MPEFKDVIAIRRVDLYSSSTSSDPSISDQSVKARLQERFRAHFTSTEDNVSPDNQVDHSSAFTQDDENLEKQRGEGTYEFHLFSVPLPKPSNRPEKPCRIRIRSPSLPLREPGFVIPSRRSSYYFVSTLSEAEKEGIQAAAISGQDVINQLRQRWPGSELPWRVTVLKTTELTSSAKQNYAMNATASRRNRNGKRVRIAIRKKKAAMKALEAQAATVLMKKEVAEREKRVRRNRGKKLKKKEKFGLQRAKVFVDN